jgi:hypothetical protein
MSFYNELTPYLDYLHSIRKFNDYLSFDMKFPDKWGIPKSLLEGEEFIPFDVPESNYKGISFTTEIKNERIDIVLSKIKKIIKINHEREMKDKLFKDYVEKLKVTFEKNNIDKLQKLNFEFQELPDLTINEYETDRQESGVAELVGE